MPIDDASREVLRQLVERIDLDDQVERVQRALEQMPEYRGFVEGRSTDGDRGPAGIRWNLEAFLRWATHGGAPAAAELEQLRQLIGARAAEGRPPEEGLAVYRRAMRAGWEAVLESADERERAALGGAFELLLEWLDIVSQAFEQAYAEERETLVSRQERRARWLLERVLEGGHGADDQRLAEALGFELSAGYRPLVAAVSGGSAAQQLQLAALLRDQGVLAASEGRRVAGLAHGPVDVGRLGFGGALILCEGAGEEQPADALAEALADLRAVADLAEGSGERGRIDAEAWLPELLLVRSPRLAQRLRDRVLGPLEDAGRGDLVLTLELLARHGFERAATAAALAVHRNTLIQRVARIEQLTGLDLDDADDRGLVWLAARCARCTQAAQGRWS